ncbi:MAG: type VI secretion system baseplate subunit TssK [Holosporales bacterium]|jgi:type VI secretion system protein ImpJ|nr:type VI secretion system baseplate subunit TssK [Holosporales bacterium]
MVAPFENPISLAVQWHEGMLLSPQHFQLESARFSALVSYYFRIARPDAYGLYDFKIDIAALSAGTVRLLSLEAIFPDGLLVQYDAAQENSVAYDLKPLLQASSGTSLRLYAAVTRRRSEVDGAQDTYPRYASLEGEEVCDDNTGDNPIRIPRLRPILRLLTEQELSGRFSAFPLLELIPDDKGPTLTSYIPPCLYASESLKDICREMIKALREKINYFSERRYALSAEGAAILRPLVQGVLPLEALLLAKDLSPFTLYQAALSTAAHALSLTPGQYLAGLPEYQHENLYAVFTELYDRLQLAMESLKQAYATIPFEKEGDGFRLRMDPSWLEQHTLIVGFRKSPEMNERDLLDWMRGAQIAAPSKITTVKDNRVLGAARKIVSAEGELGITAPQDVILLSIDPKSSYLGTREDLCIFNAGKPHACPQAAALYVRT